MALLSTNIERFLFSMLLSQFSTILKVEQESFAIVDFDFGSATIIHLIKIVALFCVCSFSFI